MQTAHAKRTALIMDTARCTIAIKINFVRSSAAATARY